MHRIINTKNVVQLFLKSSFLGVNLYNQICIMKKRRHLNSCSGVLPFQLYSLVWIHRSALHLHINIYYYKYTYTSIQVQVQVQVHCAGTGTWIHRKNSQTSSGQFFNGFCTIILLNLSNSKTNYSHEICVNSFKYYSIIIQLKN